MYLQVLIDGQMRKIDVYRTAQQEMMETLSSNPTTENYKCLGQIFKVCELLIGSSCLDSNIRGPLRTNRDASFKILRNRGPPISDINLKVGNVNLR